MESPLRVRALLLGLSLAASCAEPTEGPAQREAPEAAVIAAPVAGSLTDSSVSQGSSQTDGGPGSSSMMDALVVSDTGTPFASGGQDANGDAAGTLQDGSLRDAALNASDAGSLFDASGLPPTPTPKQVAAILSRWCGGCHQHPGSDGFVFDGQLRSTLLAAVEVPSTGGNPPGAASCRREKRVVPGDGNSYLLRKMELGVGRVPSPPVCGRGMPTALILSDEERAQIPRDLELLRRWVVEGAPLE